MKQPNVYFVGRDCDVAHHAAPLAAVRDVQVRSPRDAVADVGPGDLAIFTTEHFDSNRECIHQLRRRRVATLYLIDGILEWRNAWENRIDEPACPFTMRPVLSDKVACIGPSQVRILDAWGNQSKTELVGVPRFDELVHRDFRPVSETGPFRILVMTAKCPAFTAEQRRDVLRSLRDMRRWMEQHRTSRQREIVVHWRLTDGLDRELGVENETSDLTGRELVQQIESSDAVITTPSTGMLEAMLLGRPTALLDYTNSPTYVGAAWSITSSEHLDRVVPQLMDPSERKMLLQRHLLEDAVMLDGNSTDRLNCLVNAMLAHAAQLNSEGCDWRFPDSMLSSTAPDWSALDHREVYSEYPEFAETDLVVLQAEWAHARREIAHLQSRIEQLESELGQAHEIFEQIRRHPIAGPVVRARQSIMKFLSRLKTFGERSPVAREGDLAKQDAASPESISKPR